MHSELVIDTMLIAILRMDSRTYYPLLKREKQIVLYRQVVLRPRNQNEKIVKSKF